MARISDCSNPLVRLLVSMICPFQVVWPWRCLLESYNVAKLHPNNEKGEEGFEGMKKYTLTVARNLKSLFTETTETSVFRNRPPSLQIRFDHFKLRLNNSDGIGA